ncbi:MAG: aspartate kinase [Actinomycetota bacterium]|nr:aspartate kinase [Actinomycetota bacterium]
MTAAADPSGIVVMKFGGTSVADAGGRAAIVRRVTEALELTRHPVVVVSAMGRTGAPYATDTLLGLVDGLPADAREHDLLMATGELIAAVVVAHELRAAGIGARAYSGPEAGIGTDGVHGSSAVTEIHPGSLLAAIDEGVVPVVAGFQGMSGDGRLTTLGRGGSDTSACAIGVALGADAVEIYSDVDGVMTADPRACESAGVLQVIGADELFQLAKHGSRIVHTSAAELALSSGLALRVRNTFSDHPGTLVSDIAAYKPDRVATAVSHATGIVRFQVALPADEGTPAHMAAQTRVYRAMADADVSLDMFTPIGRALVFSLAEDSRERAESVLGELGLAHDTTSGLSKITLVGAGMHGVPGVMARMAECLADAGVSVLQTADSHTTISVLVPAADTSLAIHALHAGFELTGGDSAPSA